tara:strand:+ start:77 stop:349 length:273 start_codon:yes stop_codon:yes gene_type:complete
MKNSFGRGFGTGFVGGVIYNRGTGTLDNKPPPDPRFSPKPLTVSNENIPPPKKINFPDRTAGEIMTIFYIIISVIVLLIILAIIGITIYS